MPFLVLTSLNICLHCLLHGHIYQKYFLQVRCMFQWSVWSLPAKFLRYMVRNFKTVNPGDACVIRWIGIWQFDVKAVRCLAPNLYWNKCPPFYNRIPEKQISVTVEKIYNDYHTKKYFLMMPPAKWCVFYFDRNVLAQSRSEPSWQPHSKQSSRKLYHKLNLF